jgi:hypothetical protein
MAVDLKELPLGATAWREIINYNFALMNAQAMGIPVYASKPTTKKEELIFVTGVGFMEWKTNVSPAAYVKNLILTTADLEAFKPQIPNYVFPNVVAGTYSIYPLDIQFIHPSSSLAKYIYQTEVLTSHKMLVNGTVRCTFRGTGGQGSNDNTTIQLYKNEEPLAAAYNTSDRSLDVSVVKGDVIECRTTAGRNNIAFLRLTATLDSIKNIPRIAWPTAPFWALGITDDYGDTSSGGD